MKKTHRLLVADDQAEMRQNLARALRLEGFEVHATSNGKRALELINEEGPFDLALLDINMPEADGFTVLKTLRASEENRSLPVILITGEVDHGSVVQGKELGANDYLVKPYKIADLLQRIRNCIAQ